jgi:hypothetical protein
MVINARLCIVRVVLGDANSSFLFPKALVQSGSKKSRIFFVASVFLGKRRVRSKYSRQRPFPRCWPNAPALETSLIFRGQVLENFLQNDRTGK